MLRKNELTDIDLLQLMVNGLKTPGVAHKISAENFHATLALVDKQLKVLENLSTLNQVNPDNFSQNHSIADNPYQTMKYFVEVFKNYLQRDNQLKFILNHEIYKLLNRIATILLMFFYKGKTDFLPKLKELDEYVELLSNHFVSELTGICKSLRGKLRIEIQNLMVTLFINKNEITNAKKACKEMREAIKSNNDLEKYNISYFFAKIRLAVFEKDVLAIKRNLRKAKKYMEKYPEGEQAIADQSIRAIDDLASELLSKKDIVNALLCYKIVKECWEMNVNVSRSNAEAKTDHLSQTVKDYLKKTYQNDLEKYNVFKTEYAKVKEYIFTEKLRVLINDNPFLNVILMPGSAKQLALHLLYDENNLVLKELKQKLIKKGVLCKIVDNELHIDRFLYIKNELLLSILKSTFPSKDTKEESELLSPQESESQSNINPLIDESVNNQKVDEKRKTKKNKKAKQAKVSKKAQQIIDENIKNSKNKKGIHYIDWGDDYPPYQRDESCPEVVEMTGDFSQHNYLTVSRRFRQHLYETGELKKPYKDLKSLSKRAKMISGDSKNMDGWIPVEKDQLKGKIAPEDHRLSAPLVLQKKLASGETVNLYEVNGLFKTHKSTKPEIYLPTVYPKNNN